MFEFVRSFCCLPSHWVCWSIGSKQCLYWKVLVYTSKICSLNNGHFGTQFLFICAGGSIYFTTVPNYCKFVIFTSSAVEESVISVAGESRILLFIWNNWCLFVLLWCFISMPILCVNVEIQNLDFDAICR